ncbi:FHA domain-containing protein [Actinopolymorpha pittospori]|uniref:PSer/pThr/pTyr-binding forkhead associated (FHA) protein n=1 Tax=Actinopolymorpha pittospori TaxID=648752 RepID=A0A927N498_9ACTN|nr:FHA domain-containing protein [Actinopolymorpha pittospori]MBE1610703.1 pSer/pThr/pTyr-binding forkhead associated (FHA) protein [Actinopolymorpha pittospori]
MPFCTQCGHENAEGSRFCSQCGKALGSERSVEQTATISLAGLEPEERAEAELRPHEQAAVDALPYDSALLIVQRGPSAGSRFLLDSDVVTVGRHPESDIFLDDVTVSRRHAEFYRQPQGFAVRDVGSLNGTYVNRDRIDEVMLVGGDEVQIGKFRLVYFASQRGFGRQDLGERSAAGVDGGPEEETG